MCTATPDLTQHGGPDAQGIPRFDFSTNANACGPCPTALHAVQQADALRYPDGSYSALRAQLADVHQVAPWRVLLAGSASEFIHRITAWAAQQGVRQVGLPAHAYGDYAHAARAWGLALAPRGANTDTTAQPMLNWYCDPGNPQGTPDAPAGDPGMSVLDLAYAPLRLSGESPWSAAQRDQAWQLWTPNKALGLTGVRAAYAIAPLGAEAAAQQVQQLCPSWPVGAHGVALLQAWAQPQVQTWVRNTLDTLRQWKARQAKLLTGLGWACADSETNFFCARPHGDADAAPQRLAADLQRLRASGIKLRDATSFGLPGQVRVSVQPPAVQDALAMAWQSLGTRPEEGAA